MTFALTGLRIAAAGDAAPQNEFGFDGPASYIDWTMIFVLGGGIGVAAIFTLPAAFMLHRFRGQWQLRWRSVAAGFFPIGLMWSLMVGLLVLADKKPLDRAVLDLLGMSPEGWVYFIAMFVTCLLVAAGQGWWLRRRIAKSNYVDPAVFG